MMAGVFGLSLQVALAASVAHYREQGGPLSGWAAVLAWLSVLSLWGLGLWWRREGAHPAYASQDPPDPECDAWLRQAQREYLRRHWIEAELLVGRILARRPGDVEARLLQASIFRRTARHAAARRELALLARDPQAVGWSLEIQTELRQLAAGGEQLVEEDEPSSAVPAGRLATRRAA